MPKLKTVAVLLTLLLRIMPSPLSTRASSGEARDDNRREINYCRSFAHQQLRILRNDEARMPTPTRLLRISIICGVSMPPSFIANHYEI